MILIDPPSVPWRGRLWSHLISDTSYAELHAFAAQHGIPGKGFERDHYDVPETHYQDLLAAGAVPVSSREIVRRLTVAGLRRRKQAAPRRSLPEHAAENRRLWDSMAPDWVAAGERQWAAQTPTWGVWEVPEEDYPLLDTDLSGRKAIELGCGTGYVSSWLARRGADVTAIDLSSEQLSTARRLAAAHDVDIDFIEGTAETVPRADASFDFAISEYGAAIWCDPYVWIPEAVRLLKPGGRLVFLGNHPLVMVCSPEDGSSATPQLHRSWFDLHRLDWTRAAKDPGGIEFNLPISAWLRLFADCGLVVEDYLEIQAPAEATGTEFYVSAEWARRWPCEQVWKLRKQ